MLLKEIREMTPEQAKTARVKAYRQPHTCEWLLYVNGHQVLTANEKQPRSFASLAPIITALDAAGIDGMEIDTTFGKQGRFGFEIPAIEDLQRRYFA